jgi:methionyl-tRNA formyltransferase
MRIGFAGTPAFAATALEAILSAGFQVVLALTRPDRPHGRGMRREPGAVKTLALGRGIPVRQPESLAQEDDRDAIAAAPLDVLVVAAYGLILPRAILDWPRLGCINIHASLLPRWRGAAPIQRALLAGDAETGISIMRMDEGLDTGPVFVRHRLPIAARETFGSLHDKLATLGARTIVEVLRELKCGAGPDAVAQDATGVSYAAKIGRDEAEIDWRQPAPVADRVVRAFDPAPGAETSVDGERLKIWKAAPLAGRYGAPGCVVRADAAGIFVACGEGALMITELQRAGGKRMSAAAFLAGRRLATDARFGRANG